MILALFFYAEVFQTYKNMTNLFKPIISEISESEIQEIRHLSFQNIWNFIIWRLGMFLFLEVFEMCFLKF